MVSRPRAGLDIEPNAGTEEATKEGLFTRCEFINNAGAGIVTAGSAGAGNATFVDCTIWGTTTYSTYILHPGMKFQNCRIPGTAVHGDDGAGTASLATTFEDCTFEDKPWTDGRVYRNFSLYTLSEGVANVAFRRAAITNSGLTVTT